MSLVSAVLLLMSGSMAMAAGELVMFDARGCPWCAAWNRDIGRVYTKSAEAKVLKLRRVDADQETDGGIQLAGPVMFTPVFVITACGREVGRINGYRSREQFWGLLNAEIERNRTRLAAPC
jgi:hypothetical protein